MINNLLKKIKALLESSHAFTNIKNLSKSSFQNDITYQ
jgi:hypothetical protein